MKSLIRSLSRAVSSQLESKQLTIFHRTSSKSYSTTITTSSLKKLPYRKTKPLISKPSEPPITIGSTFSNEYDKSTAESDRDWPRPSEIPWQAKVVNSVSLIGTVGKPVQFESVSDQNYISRTVISQDSNWIPVIFEGDLAHIAVYHLKMNDCIYVVGQLSRDKTPFTMGSVQADFQVVVNSINFIQQSSHVKIKKTTEIGIPEAVNSDNVVHAISDNQSWKLLLAKPQEWWDIRLKMAEKTNAAAFEHKQNAELLWIKDSTPKWILQELESLTFDKKSIQMSNKDGKDYDSSWQDLVYNPKQWSDFRAKKLNGLVNPKYPDFKSKDGKSLWINKAPQWVLLGLEGLEFEVSTPQVKEPKVDDSWKSFVENPDKWWDNRLKKVNKKSPDFVHKDTREALWLNKAPQWVLTEHQMLDSGLKTEVKKEKASKAEDLWKSFDENPAKWWDNRLIKATARAPDFVHKDTREGLWLSSAPAWVQSKLPLPMPKSDWTKNTMPYKPAIC